MINNNEWFDIWFDSIYYNLIYSNRNYEEANLFINNLVNKLNLNYNISLIDIGCGNGRHSLSFANFIKNVTGIDISKNKINEAKNNALKNTDFFVHDMRNKLNNIQFDVVFNAFTSFGYCNNEIENDIFFNNMCDLVKKDGIFIFDYLNIYSKKNKLNSYTTKTINNINFIITKKEDSNFFYKNISVDDKNNDKKFEFEEKVRKYDLKHFTNKILLNNLKIEYLFGNYKLEEFNELDSDRLIVIAKK